MTTSSGCKGKMMCLILSFLITANSGVIYSQDSQDKKEEQKQEKKKSIIDDINGYFSLKYRFRSAGGNNDSDLYEYLNFNIGDLQKDKVSFHFFGRMIEDIGGNANNRNFNSFNSVIDPFRNKVNGQLYYAYVNVRDIGPVDYLRIGRQDAPDLPVNTYFDGARLATAKWKDFINLQFSLYGGVPVRFYGPYYGNNSLLGFALDGSPFKGNNSRLDMMYIKNFSSHPISTTGSGIGNNIPLATGMNTDTLWSFSTRQSFKDLLSIPLTLQGRATLLEDHWRDFFGQASYNDVNHDLLIQLSYFNLWQTQNSLVTEFDPYFSQLRSYFPYEQWRLSIYKGLGEHFGINVGGEERSLKAPGNVSQFNREFRRFYITPTIYKFPTDNTTISLTGELWDSGQNKFETFGADITHKFSDKLKASAGTDYQLYKFNYYSLAERDNVRSYFLRVDYKMFKNTKLNLKYSFENDSFLNYSVLELGLNISF